MGAEAFDLSINLSATGQGYKEQRAEAGGKEAKRIELVAGFLMGKERVECRLGKPNWKHESGRPAGPKQVQPMRMGGSQASQEQLNRV